ncbi:MAG TPA: hypothetical protein VMY98_04530 [Anaerolineae bacterium]|nr:hypothetical protein [Anaerolineae bacterium]
MKLFETRFSFADVLTIQPGKDDAVSHALTDLAWHQWHEAQPRAFQQYEENAYVTIDNDTTGYVATIQVQLASINLQKALEIYIARGGVCCPVCQSDDIEGRDIEVDAGGASQAITCGLCGSTWVDCYSLVRIDDLQLGEGRE